MLDVSKLEFETLLMSKELAREILADPRGFFVAVKTKCCKKVLPHKISRSLVRKVQTDALKSEATKFAHCNVPRKTEDTPETTEYYCCRCKTIAEDRGSTSCSFCNLMDGLRPVINKSNISEDSVNDINITAMHIKKLLLYGGGYRIIKDPLLVEGEPKASPEYCEKVDYKKEVPMLYPGVYDPDAIVGISNKKTKEPIRIVRGLNPKFKPL